MLNGTGLHYKHKMTYITDPHLRGEDNKELGHLNSKYCSADCHWIFPYMKYPHVTTSCVAKSSIIFLYRVELYAHVDRYFIIGNVVYLIQ